MGTRLFIGNLSYNVTEQELREAFTGEGIELPIATDHNRQIAYESVAVKMGVRNWFTPVVGNEVTTPVGHFNLFPLPVAECTIPDSPAR